MSFCMGMAHPSPQEKSSGLRSAGATNGATPMRKPSLVSRFRKKFHLYSHRKQQAAATTAAAAAAAAATETTSETQTADPVSVTLQNPRRGSRRIVVPGLPRNLTLQRVQSEKRDRLRPYQTPNHERRALSTDRRSLGATGAKASSRSLQSVPSLVDLSEALARGENGEQKTESLHSMLDVEEQKLEGEEEAKATAKTGEDEEGNDATPRAEAELAVVPRDPRESEPQIIAASEEGLSDSDSDGWIPTEDKEPPLVSREIEEEMEWRWILNLSMHFRDESNREKFFVTYAQERNIRRRLTISCDYRNAEEGTLERELFLLKFQRDKSAKIYEAIRDSLHDIMFYDTITNLKLQTSEGRLHVHVTEDVNEIIPYPPVMAIAHLRCPKYRESDLEFDSHLSGFVYKVGVGGEIMIKKEIPGPDTVDEFLYEINALYALADSRNVIQFGGCVVDDRRQKVKGLLISFAPQGALIDILFNQRGKLPWARREKWAKQIVSGLSEIHEAGYVQGDFTLSNIVIDGHDNAKIIDINRRGCPVGWEPPEITAMIEGLQRIGMYIGVKSDVFQLGMVLWSMAHEMDEPEAMRRPLTMDHAPDDVPVYFRGLVEACLCDKPQGRPSAKDVISLFPEHIDEEPLVVESGQSNGGQPPPPITTWSTANGHFPETTASQSPPKPPLSSEALESLQSTHSATPSLPPLTRQDNRWPLASEEGFSPTTQVISAAPSVSSYSSIEVPNRKRGTGPAASATSLVGGVGLDSNDISPRNSGVAIPPGEYLRMMMPPDDDGLVTPRPVTARTTATMGGLGEEVGKRMEERGRGMARGGWDASGVATPATEALSFEDAKESFELSDEEEGVRVV